MEHRHHDLVVIGTGSGNSVITPRLDHLDIGLVEKGRFGGTCLNVGCIPTKMFVLPADRVVEAREAARLGVHVDGVRADWPAIRDRIFGRIDAISDDGEAYREKAENVTVYREQARFTGPMTLDTGTGVTVTADRWVIAAGGRPRLLDVEGLDRVDPDRGVHTSDTIMRMPTLPERVVIVGGGFIAAEFAHILDGLGSHVTVGAPRAAPAEQQDESVSRALHRDRPGPPRRPAAHHRHRGSPGRRRGWSLTDEAEGGDTTTGSRPTRSCSRSGGSMNTDLLDMAAAGSALPRRRAAGRRLVPADAGRRGVRPRRRLQRVAAQARGQPRDAGGQAQPAVPGRARSERPPVRAARGLHASRRSPPSARPSRSCARPAPTTSSYEQQVGDVAYGWALEDTTGFCKVIVDPDTMLLLGAHLMGPQASTVIQPLIQAAQLRPARRRRGQGPVLDPPRPRRGRRERPPRPGTDRG